MLRLRHVAECIGNIAKRIRLVWQGLEFPTVEQLHDVRQQFMDDVWTIEHYLRKIEGEVGEVVLERPEPQLAVLINIPFPDLNESAVGRETGKAFLNGFSCKRVQYNVDTLTACELHDFISKQERSGVHHMACAH